jgi:cytochrome c-type biogenesis protein CcsB
MLESFSYTLSFVLPVLYGLTTAAYLALFVRNRDVRSKTAGALLAVTVLVHLAAVTIRFVGERHAPIANVGEAVSFFALSTTLVYVYLEARMRTQSMGIFILTIVLVFQTVATFRYEPFAPIDDSLKSAWFAVHVTGTIFSFSGFAIATVSSALYLLLYRELHAARPGFVFQRIPPLETLDAMSRRGVKLGLILLSLGILTGMMWAKGAWGYFWRWDPKMCTSFSVWLIYTAYLWLRTRASWSGRRAAYVALFGFAMIVFTFVVVDLVFHTAHRFV